MCIHVYCKWCLREHFGRKLINYYNLQICTIKLPRKKLELYNVYMYISTYYASVCFVCLKSTQNVFIHYLYFCSQYIFIRLTSTGVASYGALGHAPSTFNNIFSVHFGATESRCQPTLSGSLSMQVQAFYPATGNFTPFQVTWQYNIIHNTVDYIMPCESSGRFLRHPVYIRLYSSTDVVNEFHSSPLIELSDNFGDSKP